MTGRLISSLFPPPANLMSAHILPLEIRKPVPGWIDGSNAWRATVYPPPPTSHDDSLVGFPGVHLPSTTTNESRRLVGGFPGFHLPSTTPLTSRDDSLVSSRRPSAVQHHQRVVTTTRWWVSLAFICPPPPPSRCESSKSLASG
jgi:hypothetical protein